ncbi:MAG: hypothetical protein ACI89X_002217 [Planctomycetota bacterium]|jgi:hypothetical protein
MKATGDVTVLLYFKDQGVGADGMHSPSRHVAPVAWELQQQRVRIMRVAFLTNVISPYRAPLLEKLAETTGWDLRVFINAGNEFDRAWHDVTTDVAVQRVRTLTIRRKVRTLRPVACEQVV